MQTQLATTTGLHDHPPQQPGTPATRPARRIGLLDRLALHVGVALIRWGRRPTRTRRARPELNYEAELARQERDRLRDYYQSLISMHLR